MYWNIDKMVGARLSVYVEPGFNDYHCRGTVTGIIIDMMTY